jgi:hypothetical protein
MNASTSVYRTQASDTSREIEQLQIERWRRMSPAEKLRQVAELDRMCERLAEAGIRSRYPGIAEAELRLRRIALRLDRNTMIRVYGWDPAIKGL